MKYIKIIIISVYLLSVVDYEIIAADKPRVFVLTDIEIEPDNVRSMVLVYANQCDIDYTCRNRSWKSTVNRVSTYNNNSQIKLQ